MLKLKGVQFKVSLNGEILEEVDSFKYLGAIIGKKGGAEEDVVMSLDKGPKVSGAMKRLWKVWHLSLDVQKNDV